MTAAVLSRIAAGVTLLVLLLTWHAAAQTPARFTQGAEPMSLWRSVDAAAGGVIAYFTAEDPVAGGPVTVTTRLTFNPGGAVTELQLAGLALERDRPPDALALTWRKRSSAGLFPVWEIALAGDEELLPADHEARRPAVVVPLPNQVYQATLSYSPQSGAVSVAVTNLTSGARVYAAGFQINRYSGSLYPGTAALLQSENERAAVTVESFQVAAKFVPLGTSWRILAREPGQGEWRALRERSLDRSRYTELAFDVSAPEWPDSGHLRIVAEGEAGAWELARIESWAEKLFIPYSAAGLPSGRLTLFLEYVEGDEAWRFESFDLQVGVVWIGIGSIQLDSSTHELSGDLYLRSDGPITGATLSLDAALAELAWEGGRFVRKEPHSVPLVEMALDDLGVEAESVSFRIVIPKQLQEAARLQVRFQQRVTGGVAAVVTGEEHVVRRGAERTHVFLTDADVEAMKAKIARHPWASQIARSIERRAASWLASPLPIPEGETGWYHNYFDPRYGVRLIYDPNQPHRHVSPVDGQVFSGGVYDAAWLYLTHTRIADAALDLALAFRLTGDERYGRAAAAILLGYAERYPATVEHGSWAGKGRMMGQSLDEAVWAIALLRAYDLIKDWGVLSDDDQARIEQELFRPVAELLRKQTSQIHNIHSWHNAAIAMIGLTVGDPELVNFAVSHPASGYIAQVTQGVMDDGFWYEGSIGYHFYTISSLQHLVVALRAAGLEIPHEDRLKMMYLAPILYADPEMGLPSLNDSAPGSTLYGQADFYEFAAGWWDEPQFARVLAEAYTTGGRTRSSLNALLYGPGDVAQAAVEAQPLPSHNFEASGIGILRRGDSYVLLKYGPHGGGHGHPDKLGMVLYGLGEPLSKDLGTPGYGVPLTQTWYRQTVSHNTIVVDERTQQPTQGTLRAWVEGEDFDAITAASTGAYPGVELQRTLILTGDLLVFVDRAASGQVHTFDWVYHAEGRWDLAASRGFAATRLQDSPFSGDGYQHLANVQRAPVDGAWRVGWITPKNNRYSLWMAAGPGTELFLAEGPSNPADRQRPAVIVRRRGERTLWAGVFDLSGKEIVQDVALLERGDEAGRELDLREGDAAVRVRITAGEHIFIVSEDGQVRRGR